MLHALLMATMHRTPELPDIGAEVQAECMALALFRVRRKGWNGAIAVKLTDPGLCAKVLGRNMANNHVLRSPAYRLRLEYVKDYVRNHP